MAINAADRPIARTSAVVDRLAFIATLSATTITTAGAHAAISQNRSVVFTMMSTLLWVGALVLEMQRVRGTGPAQGPATRAGRQRGGDARQDHLSPTRVQLRTAQPSDF